MNQLGIKHRYPRTRNQEEPIKCLILDRSHIKVIESRAGLASGQAKNLGEYHRQADVYEIKLPLVNSWKKVNKKELGVDSKLSDRIW